MQTFRKIEQIQKRCLRIILDDYKSDYEILLEKGETSTMNVKRMRILATEIFKTINDLNPSFIGKIFLPLKLIPKFDQIILSLKSIIQPNI